LIKLLWINIFEKNFTWADILFELQSYQPCKISNTQFQAFP